MNLFQRQQDGAGSSKKGKFDLKNDDTWLRILFKKPIAIFGLELDHSEVFLRWLLIERARYSKPSNNPVKGWYIHRDDLAFGQNVFFECLNIVPVQVNEYSDIYVAPWKKNQ